MSGIDREKPASGTVVVRYWAAARAAAGVEADHVEVGSGTTLAELLRRVHALHEDRPKLRDVTSICSVLVVDRPVGNADPAEVAIQPGDTVELLPPFAGG
jgi:sulfur-carrier protein